VTSRPGVAEIANAVRSGKRSAVEVARDALDRAAAYDEVQPQTWITRLSDTDVASRAAEVDARVTRGEDLPLAGVPFAIKDNLDLAGAPTTAACPAFAYTPTGDAQVVARLIAAGAVPMGKTNLDQFATGLTGARSPYGALGCVYDRTRISGGSSSGSAVAVAAGIVAFALGTDTAGSGRVPAAFNGLTGFKPTRGRWSTRGLVPACRSLDCVGVFTHDLTDAALIDSLLSDFDEADPFSRAQPAEPLATSGVLGVPREKDLIWFGDAEAERLYEAAVKRARDGGGALEEVDISPLLACGRLLYDGPWVAERAAALGPFLREHAGAIHPVVRAIVQAGAALTASDVFDGYYALKAHERAAQAVWNRVDALFLPTAPTIYRISEVLAEPFALNANLGLLHELRESARHGRRQHSGRATGGRRGVRRQPHRAGLERRQTDGYGPAPRDHGRGAAAGSDPSSGECAHRRGWGAPRRHAPALAAGVAGRASGCQLSHGARLSPVRHGGEFAAQAGPRAYGRRRRRHRGRGL
jgi:allophanate hydrolase